MNKSEIIELYKKGYSIDYIINNYYRSKKQDTKVINAQMKKIILITDDFTKEQARSEVYKTIYNIIIKR